MIAKIYIDVFLPKNCWRVNSRGKENFSLKKLEKLIGEYKILCRDENRKFVGYVENLPYRDFPSNYVFKDASYVLEKELKNEKEAKEIEEEIKKYFEGIRVDVLIERTTFPR